MYRNGVLLATTTIADTLSGSSVTANPVQVGRLTDGTEILGASQLDNIEIYNVAVTPSWILASYNSQRTGATFIEIGFNLNCPLSEFTVGELYDQFFIASGGVGPFTFSITSGALPGGLSLNASTGEVLGTPTEYGVFPYIAQVIDSVKAFFHW